MSSIRWTGDNTTVSLILGGYDASKFIPANNTTFSMAQPSLINVSLQDITLNNAADKSLLPQSISVFFDTSIPDLRLPLESCRLFEEAFGIVSDSVTGRYLVNEPLHKRLEAENPSVSLLIAATTTGQLTIYITLPYASFDLELSPPYVNNTQRYFPLTQGLTPDLYTLGRVFFQEAYVHLVNRIR